MCKTKLRGDLSEIAFLQKATILGLSVSKPFGDAFPYDFIVDNRCARWRVQVKSSAKAGYKGRYQVHSGHVLQKRSQSYSSSEVDFMAFHIVREDTWYIVPLPAIRQRLAVTLYAPARPQQGIYAAYWEAWHLLQPEP